MSSSNVKRLLFSELFLSYFLLIMVCIYVLSTVKLGNCYFSSNVFPFLLCSWRADQWIFWCYPCHAVFWLLFLHSDVHLRFFLYSSFSITHVVRMKYRFTFFLELSLPPAFSGCCQSIWGRTGFCVPVYPVSISYVCSWNAWVPLSLFI